jgi:hypothetical protein
MYIYIYIYIIFAKGLFRCQVRDLVGVEMELECFLESEKRRSIGLGFTFRNKIVLLGILEAVTNWSLNKERSYNTQLQSVVPTK